MSKLHDYMMDLGLGAGWKRPFFLPPLSQIKIVEDTTVAQAEAYDDGTIKVNPEWINAAGSQNARDGRALFVLYHNIMHLLSLHGPRMGNRVPEVWGKACDMVINSFLETIGIQLPPGAVRLTHGPGPSMRDMTAEDVYDKLMKDGQDKPQPRKTRGQAQGGASGGGKEDSEEGENEGEGQRPGQGCGCLPSPGEGNGKGDGQDSRDGNADKWLQIQAQAESYGIGSASGTAFANTLKRRPLGQRLDRFVRGLCSRAVNEHGKDEQTWTKRRRNCPPYLVLPGYKAVRARVCVMIDASGSVSDAALARAIDVTEHLARISEARIFFVVHDVKVIWSGWLDGRNRVKLEERVGGRGGTSFDAAYARVAEERTSFDVLAHCTDSEIYSWPAVPRNCRRLLVGLLRPTLYTQPPAGSAVVRIEI